jgi:Fe-S cluster assembly protein SufD
LASPVVDTAFIDAAYSEFLASASAFEKNAASFAGLRAMREKTASVWRSRGLPTRKEERWKYTDLSTLKSSSWSAVEPLGIDELPLRTAFPEYTGEKSLELTILNGRLVSSWGSALPNGVQVKSAADIASRGAKDASFMATLEKMFSAEGGLKSEVFGALNASFLNDIVVVEVAPGTVLKLPIIINTFSLTTDSLTDMAIVSPRLLLKIGARAEVAVIENGFGDGRYLTTCTTNIDLAAGARLTHVRVNRESSTAVRVGSVTIDQARDSFCETFQFTLGAKLVREDLLIRLNEEGASVALDGLYFAKGKNHVDHSTSVEHVAPHTTSSQLYKGILNDEGRAVFNGRVHIHRDAQKSNASQLNKNLLLSSKAEIDTKPELEIDADDVKAAHGATIGQIDPEHVFYLQARAIPREQAIEMLSRGFAADIAFRMTNKSVRDAISRIVDDYLASAR